ncbi:DUF2505 domain-containing protein [Mycolicibacterium sp. BiH015]|uniref:DUF2505 domain-containing protein n=1 Tax=Mycolicibacterium sp. BiH015 TaxID=3018808 RepID=UPI0022E47FFC|nr:DUF2505 domain-containing protein [Mycolicibacterium sp. BiH015]MDA2890729.1 DUF2505 domain-containing protein [Mycolicibacterium sp. BiH015]
MYSFNGVADSAASVEQIHAAFGREDYWLARLAAGEMPSTLDSLVVRADGSVAVQVTQHLGRQLLPGMIAKLLPGDLTMECSETWVPDGDGRVCGRVGVVVSGGLGSCSAAAWLMRTGDGSRLGYDGTVHVKVPLVGGNLEKTIGADLAENLPSVLEFTTTWIAERP